MELCVYQRVFYKQVVPPGLFDTLCGSENAERRKLRRSVLFVEELQGEEIKLRRSGLKKQDC